MHKIKFYPVGNGDSAQIILDSGKRILLDYRHQAKAEKPETPEINLKRDLKKELDDASVTSFDVVAFTHADKDHIEGSTEFFELEHAKKYQGDGRIKIAELWVPAAMLLESAARDEQSEEFVILRQEARHRLKEGKGIKIFSKPQELVKWMEDNDIGDRDYLFVDAGEIVDTFSLSKDKVEFFCHSPFKKHCDDNESKKEIRNVASLIFNVRFKTEKDTYDFMAIGDSDYEVLEDIVEISKYHSNEDRLDWNIYKIPHHCSYLALAPSGEKGEKETKPTDGVKELLLHGKKDAYMISSSRPIGNDKEAYDSKQPPHVQAKNCYQTYLKKVKGRKLLVTMEEPNKNIPKPIVIEIANTGMKYAKGAVIGSAAAATSTPARAG